MVVKARSASLAATYKEQQVVQIPPPSPQARTWKKARERERERRRKRECSSSTRGHLPGSVAACGRILEEAPRIAKPQWALLSPKLSRVYTQSSRPSLPTQARTKGRFNYLETSVLFQRFALANGEKLLIFSLM